MRFLPFILVVLVFAAGGASVWIGPGASFAATRDVRLYGFLQLPVAQYVNGVQLTARKAAVIGVSARF